MPDVQVGSYRRGIRIAPLNSQVVIQVRRAADGRTLNVLQKPCDSCRQACDRVSPRRATRLHLHLNLRVHGRVTISDRGAGRKGLLQRSTHTSASLVKLLFYCVDFVYRFLANLSANSPTSPSPLMFHLHDSHYWTAQCAPALTLMWRG